MKHFLTALFATLLATQFTRAQDTDELLTTIGTTVESSVDNKTHAYFLWQPGDAAVTFGKRYAIHLKQGDADSPASYVRQGIQTLQGSPHTIRAMLELGAKIDPGAATAPSRIDALYRQLIFDPEAPVTPADLTLDAADKLLFILQSAVTDPETLSRLFFLGRAHPGVMMALGHGFSIPVTAGVHTFEVREVDTADNDLRVVGRVTLDTENPVIPSAPNAPFAIPHPEKFNDYHTVSPKDHLNVRMRWSIPPTLRTQLPHTFGFDMFRVKRDVAEALDWHVNPPARADLLAAVAVTAATDPDPDISRANTLPILMSDLPSPDESDDPFDTSRIDFSDDGIWHLDANGQPIRRPYQDGEAFYFYVAARNIAGIPGEVSPGTLVVMCDTLPPIPPTIESVTSQFTAPENAEEWDEQGGSQHLRIKFRQLPEIPLNGAASNYLIYRWSRSQEYLDYVGYSEINLIGEVAHDPGQTFGYFDDHEIFESNDRSVWYTIRAAGVTDCTQSVLSGHSAPLPGFLRDLKAPDTASGDFQICRQTALAEHINRQVMPPGEIGLPGDYVGFTIQIERLSPVIVAADVDVLLEPAAQDPLVIHSKRHSYRSGDNLLIHLPYRMPSSESITVRVRGVTAHGLVSDYAEDSYINVHDEPHIIQRFRLDSQKNCISVSAAPESFPVHEAYDAEGNLNAIVGTIDFPEDQGITEWRVYRRVGSDGELSLIAKNEGPTLATPAPWVDDALPAASGSRVCYYIQVLDQNANPSPLIRIRCVNLRNPDLPTPMLAPTKIVGANGNLMTTALEWFCDPVGVDRFEILIARQGGGIPQPDGLSALLSHTSIASLSPDFPELEFYRFQTPRVGSLLGDGPGFQMQIGLPADATHFFAVRACGPGEPNDRAKGSDSNVASARWITPPAPNQPVIPWPARPLPGRHDHRMAIEKYTRDEGPVWPLIPDISLNIPTMFLVGVTRGSTEAISPTGDVTRIYSSTPPETYLFKLRESKGSADPLTDLMPFMLFRYQLPSARFPDARANVVQCTPRIDRMSWKYVNIGGYYEIRDPWFRFVTRGNFDEPVPVAGEWNDEIKPTLASIDNLTDAPPYLEDCTGLIFLVDPLPVTVGAQYRHLLVQFDDRGEIRHVLPLDPVQH